MEQIHHRYIASSLANKSHRCSKVKCHRSVPLNHPIIYTNGLCERHFFSIDLSSSDDDDDDDNDKNTNLTNESKLLSKEKQIYSLENQFQSSRGDIRKTREIFDGNQWCIIEQTIDRVSSTSVTIKNNTEENFLQILRLLSNYQTVQDELKKQQQNN